ncbi:MAG: hypothetical protein ACE5EM_12135, partial [Sphingomonadales bacterium]
AAVQAADAPLAKKLEAAGSAGTFGFSPETRRLLEQGLALAPSLLNEAIAALAEPLSKKSEERLLKYFPLLEDRPFDALGDITNVARSVKSGLEAALDRTGRPFDDMFFAKFAIGNAKSVGQIFKENKDLIAFAVGDNIFVEGVRFALYVDTTLQSARIIIHEIMHTVLPSTVEEEAYLEGGVENLDPRRVILMP